ncbi:ABC transporter ATP-binding protein [Sphingobacterium haloxyli]|uniref:ABC transporter n=1 Tax=Sphingobacterium haloxyli TaxID=2100533 RepID=A0A2S9IVQ1_9SPHI|nr:ABC transporter ATP-binding protein [Sphingobacterium haloxyli]PRD44599.1 ABC transporter [Sphingobacterium haloxyli]
MIKKLYNLWPEPGLLIRLGALHAINAVLQGVLLGMLIPVLRVLLQPKPDFSAAEPWLIVGGIGLFVYAILTIIATPVGFTASMELTAKLRHRVMEHITSLPLGWFTTEQKARMARSITADVGNAPNLAVTIGAPAITATLVPATLILVTFFVDWRIALLLLSIMVLALVALRHAGNVAAIADEELEETATEIAGRAVELGQAQTVLRAAGLGVTGTSRMQEALEGHRITYRKGLQKSMWPDLTYTGVVMGGFIALIVLGTQLLVDGTLSVPDTIALFVIAVRFLEPLGSLIELIGALRAMNNAVTRVQGILDTPSLPKRNNGIKTVEDADITLENVRYSYGNNLALNGVSFHCPPGSTTALVGASGSGKTTVIRIIARFFDIDSGTVRIGGKEITSYDYDSLMQHIAVIFQDVYLFDTSIEDNLRLAKPDASKAELAKAAELACLDEMIGRLPNGWETRVGEAGTSLSGGERQRVSIARAFLKDAPIVLIDEASSALDPENEQAISRAIANLAGDGKRTVIVIAHRPTTLAAATQVVALHEGQVVELGNPAELRIGNGVFSKLYKQYEKARSWYIQKEY